MDPWPRKIYPGFQEFGEPMLIIPAKLGRPSTATTRGKFLGKQLLLRRSPGKHGGEEGSKS